MRLFAEDNLARLFQQTREERDRTLQELAEVRRERDEARRERDEARGMLSDCYRATGEDTDDNDRQSPHIWPDAGNAVFRAVEERNALQDFHDQICLALGLPASFGDPKPRLALKAIEALKARGQSNA